MPPPVMKASSKAPPAVKQEPDPAVKQKPGPELAAAEVAKQVKPTRAPTAATARSISPTKPVKVDVKTEIERRREAMLQREKDAAMQRAATMKGEVDDPEARRRASELKRQEAEAASRAAEARPRRDEDTAHAGNAAEEPAAKRPKEENVDGEGNSGVGAIKQGLQAWAEHVNALAGDDADLARRCREFVRKRILKAHAGGHLHSHDWATEPVPTVEELRCEG